jgi:hypothetical protein
MNKKQQWAAVSLVASVLTGEVSGEFDRKQLALGEVPTSAADGGHIPVEKPGVILELPTSISAPGRTTTDEEWFQQPISQPYPTRRWLHPAIIQTTFYVPEPDFVMPANAATLRD